MSDDEPADEPRAEIVPSGPEERLPESAAQALPELLRQSHREAAANRAQARELIRALGELQKAQEYLGSAVVRERRRSRLLVAALVVLPILALLGAWTAWQRAAGLESRLAEQSAELSALGDRESRAAQAAGARARAEELSQRLADLEREREGIRQELRAAHEAGLAASGEAREDREAREARERELRDRLAALEREAGALDGLRAENRLLRERAQAEASRAEAYLKELRERPAAPVAAAPAPTLAPAPAPAPAAPTPSAPAGAESAPAPTAVDQTAAGATRDPRDLERIRTSLNDLLAASGGPVAYRIESLGGVTGRRLLDLAVSGTTRGGSEVRRIEAGHARFTVDGTRGSVLLSFFDGHLVVGGRRAPFFDGRYGLLLDAETASWQRSGLTCVVFE